MSHPPARSAIVALLLGLGWAAGPARAEPLKMPGDAQKAFRDFDDAAERLGRARAAVAALEARDRPKGSAQEWAGAPAAIEAAAETLRRSEGPAIPEADAYGVPQEQLRSCATRSAALSRLERHLKSLQAGVQRCAETRTYLRDRLASVQAAEENRKALVRGAARLTDEPLLADYFTWRWADLEKPLPAAINAFATDVRRLQERVERGQGELRARAATLSSWLADYGKARDCILAGQWVGVRSLAGTVSGLAIQLVGSGTSWSGSASIDGAELPVRGVTINGSAVLITLGDRRASLNGTLSGDGRVYKGTYSSGDGPATFTLRKQ